MKSPAPSCLLLLALCVTTALAREITGPARTSCDASHDAPCSRVNSQWLATESAKKIAQKLILAPNDAFPEVNGGKYDMETGFYPFIFDRLTGKCMAHGANPDFVGKSLEEIYREMGIGFSLSSDLHNRFMAAADNGGDWVQYMWREEADAEISNKIAFVTGMLDRYYIGVGYADLQLPLELPCTDKYDSWCSINNVLSLVGKAETRLNKALSIEQFEEALYEISFNEEEFVVEGGHYLFMYHYDGRLKAHAHLSRFAGEDLTYIFPQLNRDPQEGADLHTALRNAAEGAGDGWVQYPWKNTVDEPEYIKIAFVVKIVFQGEEYFVGSGYNFIMGDIVPGDYATDLANRAVAGAKNMSCPGYNLPCSFGNTLQLTSHTLSHGLSSSMDLVGVFDGITNDPQFKVGGWGYAFMYDFNGTCVAHGGVPEFVGMNASEILVAAGVMQIDGGELHDKFRQAAQMGGGYVLYDWTDPGVDDELFQKVAFIFQLTRDGRSFYGGVGLTHERAPLQRELDTGSQQNGDPIPCSSQYGSRCSEINSQAILGQGLGDLVLASSETKVQLSNLSPLNVSIHDVFSSISAGNDLYQVNDFHIMVFALDQSQCYNSSEKLSTHRDESGCCVAHGANLSYVGLTWQEILDVQNITSIRGRDLHDRLVGQIDRGGHWIEYSWAQSSGGARTKIAFSSRFRDNGNSYYVMVEYFADALPATCDACPSDMECTEHGQYFCKPKMEELKFYQTPYFIILILAIVGIPCLGVCFCWIGKKREELQNKEHLQDIDQQMQTISQQMEHQKKTASRANKLVASLFPQQVHDRIMQQIEEEAEHSTSEEENEAEDPEEQTFTKDEWNNYMRGDCTKKTPKTSSAPIADLFPGATISFADIVGFTAWSSTREPTQVFSLLENIYRRFDRVAKRMGVFKVETVGDCYVAVCGLPEKRDDHSVVIAKFAVACLNTFKVLVKELEYELGPGTGDLRLRTGLHSGPVTAGVLRGERGRFQLFGDTVNTAARMESTGLPDQVHMSQETVDLLLDSGKSHWVTIREEKVLAKGKGILNTYWLQITAADLHESSRTGSTPTDTASTVSSGLGDKHIHTNQVEVNRTDDETLRLVEWNLNIMKSALVKVVANRELQKVKVASLQHMLDLEQEFLAGGTSLNEVKEIVSLPKYAKVSPHQLTKVELDAKITEQLREYIFNLAALYNENPFHNFQHATHVTMSVVKLLSRIVAPDNVATNNDLSNPSLGEDLHDYTFGITSDPLTQFAVLLSALIHDVDHPGVPNAQLVKERDPLTAMYSCSTAELNSLDLAWTLLMDGRFQDLRRAIYSTEAELFRFRQLLVNIVLATDIMDKDLALLRKERWSKAFANEAVLESSLDENVNRKATIVLEHLIQASDVAHTMQHWNVYVKWNERFFFECMAAYRGGRAEKDPSENWYQGEIGFFDFYIIPLAKKLKDCGVFGVSSAEYLTYAEQNRKEWEARGKDIVAGFLQKMEKEDKRRKESRRHSG
ncbi:adenylate/guanylate cyclase with GAF and PAS/PAC sensor domain [Nitzschia inconspicua]|uniref:Adenylate/guanylate cyclase with GAF and PAS/PAC sensor domain n=1 Tax=Nitzschia inconspicua TaxID=303405 RepID=A0A9K3M6U0_9STRA|nr:adenylate/guanylate cyclase with GAF and PAS/PAC sensor domain [Nitzschia inconspicua]